MADDLRYALRSLLNSRGFTAVALLVIALSVGAIAPIYAIVDAVVLRPLPYPDADRLVIVRDIDIPTSQAGRLPMSQRNYVDWAVRQQGFEGIAGVRRAGVTAKVDENEHDIGISQITGNFFTVLRQRPARGRLLDADDVNRAGRVAVISHEFWQRALGGREDVLGKLAMIGDNAYEVIGIARPDFIYPAGSAEPDAAFVPLVITPAQRTAQTRGTPFLTAIGRLGDGVSTSEAQVSMDAVAAVLRRDHSGWDAGVTLQPYHEYVTGRTASWMRLLLWGGILLFLIMCANVANLLLARGGARRREVAVRAALGASRSRIARQLLVESLLLAVAGTAAGLMLGWWTLDVLRASIPEGVPRTNEIAMDWRVVGVAALAAAVTGGVFGLAPAVLSTRVDLSSSLKGSAGSTGSAGAARLRSLLIIGEVAVALVLLVGALLFAASFLKVTSVPLGVDYNNVVVTYMDPPPLTRGIVRMPDLWARSEQHHALAARIIERVRAVPGVDDAAVSSGTPFEGGSTRFSYELPGKPDFKWSRENNQPVAMKMVSPNYLELLRIPLLRGRYLTERDGRDDEGAVVLSESAARMIWPGEEPIGHEIDLQKRLRVVGVVADVRMGGHEVEPWPDVYVPMLQGRGTIASTIVIRTHLPAGQLLPSLRAAIQEVDPAQRVRRATTLETRLEGMLAQRRFNLLVVGSFGALAVLIAAIGLYGAIAYLVTQRTKEIGVRMALGASRGNVVGLVLRRAAVLTALGLAAGGAGIWYFSASVQAFLFRLDPLEPRILGAAVLLMAVTAMAAALVPARRAASVDPLIALRQD